MATSRLPVHHYKEKFLSIIQEHQTLVVIGETGSGKTTQIPQWCVELCYSRRAPSKARMSVACTQPRRIAAMSVATRVAQERKVTLGNEVGYSVRFDNCSSSATQLKYLTDGMLLREAMLDYLLSAYRFIIIDEAHERTLPTEILFGVIKRAMRLRNRPDKDLVPLKVVIMSATINVDLFKSYFRAEVLHIEGRQHPVQDLYAQGEQSDRLAAILITVFQVHRTEGSGDILVFCSGVDEIHNLISHCKKLVKKLNESLQNITFLPLYAALPVHNQMKVFQRRISFATTSQSSPTEHLKNERRVIFATNVAETSVTIPNIKFVIDTGKVKCRNYCPKTGIETLKEIPISKAQAKQRSGRAGRVGPGICYRLYTDQYYADLSPQLLPEIKRCNLDSVILQMISIGIKDVSRFEYLEKPEDSRLASAINNLLALKAIRACTFVVKDKTAKTPIIISNNNKRFCRTRDDDNTLSLSYELTSIGKKLSAFPLEPAMGRIILVANQLNCLDEAITVVAMLIVENLFHIPPSKEEKAEEVLSKFRSNEGDTVMLLKLYKAYKRIYSAKGSSKKHSVSDWMASHYINSKNLKQARQIRKQLQDLCAKLSMPSSSCADDTKLLRRALTYGLFNNVATMQNGKYRNKFSDDLHIHPSSCLFKTKPETILYTEIVETNKSYMRNCTLIDMSWIREISSANIRSSSSSSSAKV